MIVFECFAFCSDPPTILFAQTLVASSFHPHYMVWPSSLAFRRCSCCTVRFSHSCLMPSSNSNAAITANISRFAYAWLHCFLQCLASRFQPRCVFTAFLLTPLLSAQNAVYPSHTANSFAHRHFISIPPPHCLDLDLHCFTVL